MAERTSIQSMTGAKLALSASLPATYDAAGYGATGITYTVVGKIENFGEHGGEANVATFTAVDDGVVDKIKGSKNYGDMQLTLGSVPSDAGQALIDTAFESTSRYSAKLTYPLGQGETTAEIHYMEVLVTRRVWQDGAADDVRRVGVTLAICRKPVIVDAT